MSTNTVLTGNDAVLNSKVNEWNRATDSLFSLSAEVERNVEEKTVHINAGLIPILLVESIGLISAVLYLLLR